MATTNRGSFGMYPNMGLGTMAIEQIQTFIEPHTFITVNALWFKWLSKPAGVTVYAIMPVVAHMTEATINFDCINGAN